MSLKYWQCTHVTDLNHGKWTSPHRPGNTALAEANEHAAKVRHRNRRARWCDRWLPFRLPVIRRKR